MGVTGLWTVLHPAARPTKLETLSQKRLAIDASIWIYQFLKAVRDKEGNALRNSHVVGFFRRICKLLFLGIKPVFVFDGGAPALKRQTIAGRKRRREGRREDAIRTAGKLLAVQMQRRAEEDSKKRVEGLSRQTSAPEGEETVPENLVYAEEVHLPDKERQQNRKFRKKDAYHLPQLDVSLAEMGQPNDPRIMSLEELEEYARQFDAGEDINVYDFSKIDFDSPFFMSLPASDRYNILNAARLRSRLRMGYSKDQLDTMFPDRMAFSRFQIERVTERNELTQRLMNINGMNGDAMFGVNGTSRVAGEKGREYVLVKNDGVEGGWALGVVTNKDEGKREKPIDVEIVDQPEDDEDEDWEGDDFEDVPIEGLNRLPKRSDTANTASGDALARDLERRRALYKSRKTGSRPLRRRTKARPKNADSLFVAEASDEEENWETIDTGDVAGATAAQSDDSDDEARELQQAIAMSLQPDSAAEEPEEEPKHPEFTQTRVGQPVPFTRGSGLAVAHVANARSNKATPRVPFAGESDDEDEADLDMGVALASSRKQIPDRSENSTTLQKPDISTSSVSAQQETNALKPALFDGPLPFEKLDLGSSLLGKKKMKRIEEEASGGFEKPSLKQKKKSKPLPPWFTGNLERDQSAAKAEDEANREEERAQQQNEFEFSQPSALGMGHSEVVDLDAMDTAANDDEVEVLEIDDAMSLPTSKAQETVPAHRFVIETPDYDHIESAERVRDRSPKLSTVTAKSVTISLSSPPHRPRPSLNPTYDEAVNDEATYGETPHEQQSNVLQQDLHRKTDAIENGTSHDAESAERPAQSIVSSRPAAVPSGVISDEEDFEDVALDPESVDSIQQPRSPSQGDVVVNGTAPDITSEVVDEQYDDPETLDLEPADAEAAEEALANVVEDDGTYSDPEDEELFRQFIAEQAEHERFTASLNTRSVQQGVADYERELKQLRNQQKKDRRDADEVTSTMVTDCQQLLSLFGLPYITAPMEAEAQCAELVHLGLVDGIVTDDSDIFLFGGTRVYKNMFNQAKFVECFLTSDLEAEFGLTRQRLIAIAQLLGSDYTEGLPGVGPVTAVELVSEFENLAAFKRWWDTVQSGKLAKSADAASAFRSKFRKSQGTKLFLPPTFPDPRVEMAYLEPEVDSDPSAFVWGVPDLNALRAFLMSTIGWGPERTDEILVPVIKDMNQRQQEGTQRNITSFYGGGVGAGAFAPRRRQEGGSRRLETALAKMGEKARTGTVASDGTVDESNTGTGRGPEKRQSKRRNAETADSSDDTSDARAEKSKRKSRKIRR